MVIQKGCGRFQVEFRLVWGIAVNSRLLTALSLDFPHCWKLGDLVPFIARDGMRVA